MRWGVAVLIYLAMGNSTSSPQASNVEQHSILGEVVLGQVMDEQGSPHEQMTITRVIESEAEFNRWYKQVNKIDDTVTREVLLLPNKTVYESTGLCGSTGLVRLTYDHYPYVFQVEVDNRRKLARFFLETELWYLLYSLVRGGSKFEKYRLKIGDVHPANILINNDGLIKLVSTCSFPREETNFDKVIENPHRRAFLAPEELEQHSLERAEYPKNIDPSLAECYSIGLCVLAAGTLEDVDAVYLSEHGGRRIQRHRLNYLLKLFGEKYSSFLHSLVMGLLADNPADRKRCSEIYSALYEYEDKILDLESFLPNSSRLSPYIPATNAPLPFPQQPTTMSMQPTILQSRPIFQQEQVQSRPNAYFLPNALLGSPIESKYVPVSPMHAQSAFGFRQSFPVEQGRGFPLEEQGRGFRGSGNNFISQR